MTDTSQPAGAMARNLMRSLDWAALGTVMPDGGHPYASLVLVAADYDASPILLLSDLAEHARNIAADNRVSLLFDGTRGLPSPLTGARVSIQGRAVRSDAGHLRQRFLARHGDAAGYADFADFAFYKLVVERGHLVAGFGKIEWIDKGALLYREPGAEQMKSWEGGAVSHMNEDHGEAIQNYAQNLLGAVETGWVMTGCDPEGCDLRRGGEVLRLEFPAPANDADSLRQQLVALARAAQG
jgi:heme iron utilization protein